MKQIIFYKKRNNGEVKAAQMDKYKNCSFIIHRTTRAKELFESHFRAENKREIRWATQN